MVVVLGLVVELMLMAECWRLTVVLYMELVQEEQESVAEKMEMVVMLF